MHEIHRSLCAINLSLEVFGDKWTLLILRDMVFGGKRHFRELLRSEEGISSNVLADRLSRLVAEGIITRADDPSHKQKAIYSLTEKGIVLLPVFVVSATSSARPPLPASGKSPGRPLSILPVLVRRVTKGQRTGRNA